MDNPRGFECSTLEGGPSAGTCQLDFGLTLRASFDDGLVGSRAHRTVYVERKKDSQYDSHHLGDDTAHPADIGGFEPLVAAFLFLLLFLLFSLFILGRFPSGNRIQTSLRRGSIRRR